MNILATTTSEDNIPVFSAKFRIQNLRFKLRKHILCKHFAPQISIVGCIIPNLHKKKSGGGEEENGGRRKKMQDILLLNDQKKQHHLFQLVRV
jgi:hypothetical protein